MKLVFEVPGEGVRSRSAFDLQAPAARCARPVTGVRACAHR